MELRHDGPLPSYREELIPSQYVSLRTACVLAAALLVAFSLLDRELTPDWLPLLAVRLAGGLLLLLCGQAAGRGRGSPFLLCMVAVGLIAGIVAVVLLLPPPPSQRMALLVPSSYLLCMTVVSVAGAAAQDRLRRREHQARAE